MQGDSWGDSSHHRPRGPADHTQTFIRIYFLEPLFCVSTFWNPFSNVSTFRGRIYILATVSTFRERIYILECIYILTAVSTFGGRVYILEAVSTFLERIYILGKRI